MIKSIPSTNKHDFYEDKNINALVDVSLSNLDNDIFLCIINSIIHKKFDLVKEVIEEFKYHNQDATYDYIKSLFYEIYVDNKYKDNLRGCFLELLIFKFLNNKYSSYPCYFSAMDCFVEIFGNKSDRTVDVFAFWFDGGFVSEIKIGGDNFENHDIENLNKIYVESNGYLKPYIITLSSKNFIDYKLKSIVRQSDTSLVHTAFIKVFSIENIKNLFNDEFS